MYRTCCSLILVYAHTEFQFNAFSSILPALNCIFVKKTYARRQSKARRIDYQSVTSGVLTQSFMLKRYGRMEKFDVFINAGKSKQWEAVNKYLP